MTNKTQTLLNELFTIKGYILKHTIIITFCKRTLFWEGDAEVSGCKLVWADNTQWKVSCLTRPAYSLLLWGRYSCRDTKKKKATHSVFSRTCWLSLHVKGIHCLLWKQTRAKQKKKKGGGGSLKKQNVWFSLTRWVIHFNPWEVFTHCHATLMEKAGRV